MAGSEDEITADLIAGLLREQHPDLADLPLRFGARGWDNQLWRLGDDLAVRLPWATQDADELLPEGARLAVDFGDMCAGDPACDLAACWMLLPDGVIGRFHQGYSSAADAATLRRARGWALWKALACLLIGDAGARGRPGGKVPRVGLAPTLTGGLVKLSRVTIERVCQEGADAKEDVRQAGAVVWEHHANGQGGTQNPASLRQREEVQQMLRVSAGPVRLSDMRAAT